MKLAIIGAGMIVKDFLTISQDLEGIDFEAIIGTEVDIESMKELCEKYDVKGYYTDFDNCLESSDWDTLYIGLPNHLHYVFAKKALKNGKNVICEKPFTLSKSQLLELGELAFSKELILLEAITNQYLSNYQSIKETLPTLGDIKLVTCNYSQYSSRYDAFKEGTVLPAFNPKFGGGALMDINIYNIHFVIGLFGLPKSVSYHANVERDIDTSGILVLDYDDKKIVCVGAKDSTTNVQTSIQGTEGFIETTSSNNIVENFDLTYYGGDSMTVDNKIHAHRMFEEFKYFNQIIQENDIEEAHRRYQHSLDVMEVVELALADAGITLG